MISFSKSGAYRSFVRPDEVCPFPLTLSVVCCKKCLRLNRHSKPLPFWYSKSFFTVFGPAPVYRKLLPLVEHSTTSPLRLGRVWSLNEEVFHVWKTSTVLLHNRARCITYWFLTSSFYHVNIFAHEAFVHFKSHSAPTASCSVSSAPCSLKEGLCRMNSLKTRGVIVGSLFGLRFTIKSKAQTHLEQI